MTVGRGLALSLTAIALLAVAAVLALPPALAATAVLASLALTVLIARRQERRVTVDAPPPAPAHEHLQQAVAPLRAGIVALDAERNVLVANPAAERVLARPPGSMTGVSLIQALRDHDLAEVARSASGVPVELHLSAANRDVIATAVAVDIEDVRTVLTIEDVTDLHRAQRARSELVANVSHELRTPIAAARALAETLEVGVEEPEERERFHRRLVEEIDRLGAIVQRLLWLARVESGTETFSVERIGTADLLREAVSRIGPVAANRGIRLEVVPDAAAESAFGDRERVLEVLSNLLDNAIRYSPEDGVVRLSATLDGAHVRFEVADQGPGVPPGDRERLFERFYTGDRARSPGGTGLGLAIARHIVQRLGGRIWIEDHAPPGARICFTLNNSQPSDAHEGGAV
jgi:two-component system phosphate regulon sensor histidine kinase PhoR